MRLNSDPLLSLQILGFRWFVLGKVSKCNPNIEQEITFALQLPRTKALSYSSTLPF